MAWWYDRNYYAPSRPREAKGGIKAQTKRGSFGQSWWAKRWIAVLESFDIGARLGRGRAYARKGQVLSIDIEKGCVTAKVQGSRARPYEVTIQVKTLSNADVKRLSQALSQQAVFSAKLLAGEMPEKIEEVFEKAKLSLFPNKSRDLATDCSCPDWSNPCKHIAAVYYLLGEEFHRDPFLIFRLRGIERDQLIGSTTSLPAGKGKYGLEAAPGSEMAEGEATPPEPLSADPETFWGSFPTGELFDVQADMPGVSAARPKRLGNFPLWRGEEHFLTAMETVYEKASRRGLEILLAEPHDAETD